MIVCSSSVPPLSLEEETAGVRAVDLDVTIRAGLVLIGLVMEGRRARCGEVHRCGMALQAQRVHVIAREQTRIRRTMGEMARRAPLDFERRVLVYERACGLCVTLGADGVLVRARKQQFVLEGAVGIMAVRADQHALGNLVVKWLCERRLHIRMAAIAELRLGDLQQMRYLSCGVAAVTTRTSHARGAMRCPFEVGVRARMTAQALIVDHSRGRLRKLKYLRNVPTGFHMRLPRAVATLARYPLATMLERKLRVRVGGKLGGGLSVAGRANLRANVVDRVDRLMIPIRSGWLFLIARTLRPAELAQEKDCCEYDRLREQTAHPGTSPTVTTVLISSTAITRT
jgi:hypothetical protein